MIYTERKITISNSGASIDSPIILYRGDKEIEILFTIVDSKFKFSSEKGNYIINTGAKFAQLAVDLPDGTDLFTDISECLDGAVIFKITGDMIDEIREIGFYSFHIRLFDESKKSRITIPPVLKGIEIKSPMVTESTVGYATADNSRVDDNEESFIDEDGKLTIEWKKGDVISSVKLNQMVEVVNNAVDEEKQRQQNELVRQNNEEIRQDAIEYAVETYDMTINELNAEKNKIKPYVDDILESAISEHVIAFTEVEGSVISELSFDGYLKDLEILGNTIQDADNLADIRSVGDKVENQELYEIPVLIRGKNLFDGKWIDKTVLNLQQTSTLFGKPQVSTDHSTAENFIPVRPNTTYHISSSTAQIWVVYYDRNKTPISHSEVWGDFSTGDDIFYIRFYDLTSRINNNPHYTISIAKKEEYEPYQEQRITILSPVQLEKVEDVADRIICKDGVWGVEKNIGTIVLDGAMIETSDVYNGFNLHVLTLNDISTTLSGAKINLISDVGNAISYNNRFEDMKEGNIYATPSSKKIYFITTKEVSIINAELKDKNIKYILGTPTFIPLPHDQQIKLRTFANKTNIHFLTEIEPTLKASVPKSLGATVNTHTEQIDNLGKELDRVKKLEESTTLTITTESDFTTVENTSNGYFEDVKLEGRTLVNLYPKLDANNYTPLGVTLSNDTITINANGSWRNFMLKKDVMPLKTSTYYTFVIYIIDNTIEGDNPIIHFGDTLPKDPTKFRDSYHFSLKNKKGIYAFKLKTKDSFDNVNIDTRDHLTDKATSGTIVFKYMILEGDHTQNPPSYFEGLKSVGQDVEEISVESRNINLYNVDNMVDGKYLDQVTGDVVSIAGRSCSLEYIPIKKNTLYFNQYEPIEQLIIHCYNINKTHLKCITIGKVTSKTLALPEGTTFIRLAYAKLKAECRENGIYLGSIDINYKPHQSNKKPLLYYNPTSETWEKPILRQWDSIEKHTDGKYYYHKRSVEVVLNGNEFWELRPQSDSQDVIAFNGSSLSTSSNVLGVVCDKFPTIEAFGEGANFENIFIATSTRMQVRILKSKLSTQDVAGFKAWLQANPTTVVYQLAEEKVYECTNLDLITYSGETNLLVKSGVLNPKVSLKVSKGVGNVVTMLQNKVTMLEKMVYNLMKMLDNQQSNIDE